MHQVVSAPRPRDESAEGEFEASGQLSAALVAAHSQLQDQSPEAALMSAWVREPGREDFRFLIGARPGLPGVRASSLQPGRDAVPYPPGCLGLPLLPGALADLLEQFPCWLRCPGEPDVLWSENDAERARSRTGSFAEYASHLNYPFAWVVVAQPLPDSDVDRELLLLANDLPGLRLRVNSEADRVSLQRGEARFRELTRAQLSGLWNVHVLVGALTAGQARAAAAVLCSASDIDRLPYALVPGVAPGALDGAWAQQGNRGRAVSPFPASSDLVAALTAPPTRELPGIRLLQPNPFDVTPEDPAQDGMTLGTVLDRRHEPAGFLAVSRATLNRHTFISGATGSGKSQTTRGLLEELSRADPPVPWLVVEPAKAEYARMAGRLRGTTSVLRIRPGDPDVPPASLNPLEPAKDFPLQSHLDLVRALFLAAFEAAEPFPQVLAQALTQTYRSAGWDLVTGEMRTTARRGRVAGEQDTASPRYPRLDELQVMARRVVDDIGYGKEVTANVKGFIEVRIGSLCTGTPGRFFQGGHPLDVEDFLRRNVVFELEGITDDQDKAFLMGALMIRLVEHLRVRYGLTGCDTLEHVTVIEEAHRLLKRVDSGPAAAAVELFASLLAEIRAYGEGLVVVEQIPSKIVVDVIKNTALKVVHRLPSQDDRESVGGTMNLLEEQSRAVVALPPGTAAVAVDGMDRPVLIKVSSGAARDDAGPAHNQAPFTGTRSTTCAPDCRDSACTLRQMNQALHNAGQPELVLWVEAVLVAYLMGFVPPVARPHVRAILTDMPNRELDCTLSYLAERSISARRAPLHRYMDPASLELEVHAQLRHQLKFGAASPVPAATRWQAGPHLYRDVARKLRLRAQASQPVEAQLLQQWAQRGLDLAGLTTSTALKRVEDRQAREPADVVLGDPKASGLLTAIEATSGSASKAGVRAAISGICAENATVPVAVEVSRRLPTAPEG
ncbi:ATP-binding protein [Modestobacter marinus]|uniref:ATP-binding protein n=1 Tax=Modestobacter marinus TaxID=477641 RepID=UPI001C937DC1|nr:ATP-binding protein [Modestobacter marinus]